MIRSIYTAATAMIAQNRRFEVISNNVANFETPGYKQDQMVTRSFRDMMIHRLYDADDPSVFARIPMMSGGRPPYVGPHNTGIHIDRIFIDFSQGSLEDTFRVTDFALIGDGFFSIETPDGTRFTRNGVFYVDQEGFLTTADGGYVLGQGGRIHLVTENFRIDPDGNIFIGEDYIDTLALVRFEDNNVLRKQGGNLFYIFDEDIQPFPAEGLAVRQFALEVANIDLVGESVRMLEVYRSYELNQRFLRLLDENLGRAVNDIGRI
jgi:flagellar basal-body rod protein FlgG